MSIFQNYKERHEFNAENCRRKQQKIKDDRFARKAEDIKARIDFVVQNSTDEHAVIYCVKKEEKELFTKLSDFFYNKGFFTVITKIEGLDDEYLIISW